VCSTGGSWTPRRPLTGRGRAVERPCVTVVTVVSTEGLRVRCVTLLAGVSRLQGGSLETTPNHSYRRRSRGPIGDRPRGYVRTILNIMVFYSSIDGHGPADTVCCGVKPGRGSRLLTVGAPGHSRRNGYQNGDQFQGLIRLS
jgi:hypothetical protein